MQTRTKETHYYIPLKDCTLWSYEDSKDQVDITKMGLANYMEKHDALFRLFLINDVLEMSKLESGEATISPRETTASRLCQTIIKMLTALAQEKDLDLIFEDVAECVEASPGASLVPSCGPIAPKVRPVNNILDEVFLEALSIGNLTGLVQIFTDLVYAQP